MSQDDHIDIRFNVPAIDETDIECVLEALQDRHLSGDGRFTRLASELLSDLVGGNPVLLTTSCTHALEMTGFLMGLEPGDEVVLPSFTFVSTANAYVTRGVTPVFVDVRRDTLNIDESQVEAAITPRTKGIVVVHYGGVAAEMDTLRGIAESKDLWLVEDNAHGLGASYKGQALGSIGDMAAQSFHATKNVVMGEGGALILNSGELLRDAEIIREKGTNRSQFLRGAIDKYTWVDSGSSYLPSDVLSALLYAQLGRFGDIQARRHEIWNAYMDSLRDWAEACEVRLPIVPDYADHAAHLFYLLMPTEDQQPRLISHLAESGIGAASHYRPLHDSPFGVRTGWSLGDCPVTKYAANAIVRLPLHTGMSDQEVERVVAAIESYRMAG